MRHTRSTGEAAERWVACLWLPRFALCAERARQPERAAGPLVLVAPGARGRPAVVQVCSPEAQRRGLAVGAPAHTIPQRCPDALVRPFDAPYYQQQYEALLAALNTLSPVVEPQPPEAFYLDLSGLPLWEGRRPEPVAAALRAVLPPSFSWCLGIAPGKFTAWVAAHSAAPGAPRVVQEAAERTFLRAAPSALLPTSNEILRQLHLLGLHTLSQIAALPRAALLARFGWEGERLHRLACGEDREPLLPWRPAPAPRETWIFSTPPTTARFYLALEQLLRRVWARPERGDRGVRQIRLLARQESGEPWERRLTLREPAGHWEDAFAELKRRLEPILPAGALTELTVELTAFAARLDRQDILFRSEPTQRQERLQHALAHLRERRPLQGRAPVFRIVEVDPWSGLPEERYGLIPYDR